ncbi:Uncharacterized protein TCM_008818 [Theobroma cacao]|uniref:Uncharacterized protein n=1 Tax=Theobroma cacao TaxID=3641 RepID=A0A061E4F0_THECC|nr:Uncharacterized protein TCM_008818 [Theobroma cacao]
MIKGKEPKLVLIIDLTRSEKSRSSIDLATHFPNFMQVYQGLNVLTNKVSLHEQKVWAFIFFSHVLMCYLFCQEVTHHLLDTVCLNVEFTAKN